MELHPENLKPFTKNDPRINKKGAPKNIKQLRALIVAQAAEPTSDGRTKIQKMIDKMLASDNPADRALAMKYGYGNVPDELDVKHSGKVTLKLSWPEDE